MEAEELKKKRGQSSRQAGGDLCPNPPASPRWPSCGSDRVMLDVHNRRGATLNLTQFQVMQGEILLEASGLRIGSFYEAKKKKKNLNQDTFTQWTSQTFKTFQKD